MLRLAQEKTLILHLKRKDVRATLAGLGYSLCGLALFAWIHSNVGSEFCCCRLIVVPVVAPSDVGGGGGASRELTITWTVGWDFPLGKVGRWVTCLYMKTC